MLTINCLAVVCLVYILLAVEIESRSAPHHHALHVGSSANTSRGSSIPGHHHHVTTPDDPTEELVLMEQENADRTAASGLSGLTHQLAKRSTETVEKPNNTMMTVDWKSIKSTLSEVIRKLVEFVSTILRKLKDRLLMHAFVPFLFPSAGNQDGHPAVAMFTSVDWRSAATTLFNSLNQFQHLRMNEVW